MSCAVLSVLQRPAESAIRSGHDRQREFLAAFTKTTVIRPISSVEAAVLENVLRVGAVGTLSSEAVASVKRLCVTATCKCGCATVWFGPKGEAANGSMAAEACGTWEGETIGIIVWCADGQIVGLEVVGTGTLGLPDPASVRPLERWFQAT